MINWPEYVQFLIVLIAIVDIPGNVPVFLQQTQDFTHKQRQAAAIFSGIATFFVLIFFAFAGEVILLTFGISLADFKVLGGIVVLLLALEMLGLLDFSAAQAAAAAKRTPVTVAVFPMAVPLFAGPGSISAVLIYAHYDFVSNHDVFIAALLFGASCLVAAGMLTASLLSQVIGPTTQVVLNRVLGMLVGALGIEFISAGVRELMQH